MKEPKSCKHEDFAAQVNVARIEDKGGFYADITIKCAECDTPFHFVGVEGGLSPRGPRCDPFGIELRAPIKAGLLPYPLQRSVFEMMPDQSDADITSEAEQ